MNKLYIFIFTSIIFILPFIPLLAEEGTFDNSPPVELTNPIGETNPNILIGKIINAVLGVVGSLALLMFVYGGLNWMMAAGNNERVQKGKDILIWATLGLIIVFSAYALIKFIFDGLGVK